MAAVVLIVVALLAIAGATALAHRLPIPSPLLLVVVGVLISLLPAVPPVEVDPEWVLAGILPPLLYSAAVAMPSMSFRREFTSISGLSIVLVVLTTVVLGLLLHWLVPGLDLAWAMALGAVLSPTDAVAVGVVKRAGVAPRLSALLEGEGLLNDATALVALSAAIGATVGTFSVSMAVGSFVWSVVVAVALGVGVGHANLALRARTSDSTLNTLLSFTAPFLASIPAELLGASGLVAAVAAGLVAGWHGARVLPPRHRLSDHQNWATVEMVLEGTIFLLMGLQLFGMLEEVHVEHEGLGTAAGIALAALLVTLLVRAAYVAPLLRLADRRARRHELVRPKVAQMHEWVSDPEIDTAKALQERRGSGSRLRRELAPEEVERFATRVRRMMADIDYFLGSPLTWREGAVIVWAGMRGAVTVAAAQTLPSDTPQRALLVLVAFVVATVSLLVQGGTLPWVIRVVRPAQVDPQQEEADRRALRELLWEVGGQVEVPPADPGDPASFEPYRAAVLERIRRQRDALLDARDDGIYGAETLDRALINLEADQIALELKGGD